MSAKLLGFLANLCYVAAFVLFAAAFYLWWMEADGPGASVEFTSTMTTAACGRSC